MLQLISSVVQDKNDVLLKDFLSRALSGPPVQWSGTIYTILEEGIMGNIHVKLFEIWTSGSGDIV